MWKRNQQILDVYGIKNLPSQSKDDSLIPNTRSLYKLPLLSHSQPTFTRSISSSRVYQGNEFDVFSGKQDIKEESMIEVEKTTIKVIKRTSIDYLIDKEDETRKKRRTLEPSTITLSNDKSIITNPHNVFIKSTAPANTPANIFMTHSEAEQDSYDLEYS
ncbi:hypothetical protein K501DRAFT_288185 [Backusella circina FSU 941]|nr:hypothetical protein K501DRAFT_288185 [Backusella circina FSU 941]